MRALDLFCGACGGWSLGLHRAGIQTIAACEIDPWRRDQFSKNFPEVKLYGDIRELTARRLAADGLIPDLIVGSPPCQDASAANQKGRGVEGERTGLFFEALRLVRELRPRWCAFENSPRLRTRGIDRLLGEMEADGYTAWPLVVGASDLGANHIRKRLILIAANTNKITVREQSGRGGWTNWKDPALSMGDDGAHWTAGTPDLGRVDDGLPPRVARACVSAYGDAILPQKAELVGRAILHVESLVRVAA